jgi:hypothetical protein
MSQSMRLSDELVEAARKQASLYHRSPPQQIEHWAAIGRVAEQALDFPAEEKLLRAVGRAELDAALSAVGKVDGSGRARDVIRRTSAEIVSKPAG